MMSTDNRVSFSPQPFQNYQLDEDFGADPVFCHKMVNPVIDQEGHTFDQSTIDICVAESISKGGDGKIIKCPLYREKIIVAQLVPNLFAKEAIEREQRMIYNSQNLPKTSAVFTDLSKAPEGTIKYEEMGLLKPNSAPISTSKKLFSHRVSAKAQTSSPKPASSQKPVNPYPADLGIPNVPPLRPDWYVQIPLQKKLEIISDILNRRCPRGPDTIWSKVWDLFKAEDPNTLCIDLLKKEMELLEEERKRSLI
jgi:hypothetical protein